APSGATAAVGTPDMVQEMARQAVLLDAKGDRAADTLYAPDALVVANARVRLGTPRFAGVGLGGRATVAAAAVTLEGRFAWVLVNPVAASHNAVMASPMRPPSTLKTTFKPSQASTATTANPRTLRNMGYTSVKPRRRGRTSQCSSEFQGGASR